MLLTISRIASLVLGLALLLSCGGGEDVPEVASASGRQRILSATVTPVMEVQLPFVDGDFYRCTQNSNDTPTHNVGSTRYDLDFGMPVGSIVVAAAAGTMHIYPDTSKTGGFGWFAKIDHHNGYWTMYAHLSGFIATEGQSVVAGQPIAYSGGKNGASGAGTSTAQHLHFGVHKDDGVGESVPMRVKVYNRSTGVGTWLATGGQSTEPFKCDTSTSIQDGHVYEARPIGAVFGDWQCGKLADGSALCWFHQQTLDPSCTDGTRHVWYRKNGEGAYLSEPGSYSQCLNLVAGQVNVFAYLEGGYGVGGYGPGIEIIPNVPPALDPPDFVNKRTWLETPWGTETYRYGRNEVVKMKARFENIGDGPCNPTNPHQTIPIHFYLSRGYKEDAHSVWKLVGTDEIQCSNLLPGATHTETEGIELWRDIPELGIWNIVACVDHPLTQNNNGGYHPERHESNNCSTEAVFEVVDGTVNVPDVDLIPLGFTLLQAPTYAGDFIRLGAWVKNQGAVNATADIRSRYGVSCNGAPETMLTDDGTMASTLAAGASAWEETITPVQLPNVAGTCTLTFAVDYQAAQPETDETNNTQTLTVTLLPRPAPRLTITQFRDDKGCCTTNRGSSLYPRIWVRNDGPVAPGANVTVVYEIANINVGGPYSPMGTGTIEPRELPPGGTDEDKMDCDGCYRVPSGAEWKNQWHYIRACLRADGGAPSYAAYDHPAGEVCAIYWRFSKS